jgi:hypothetical protein
MRIWRSKRTELLSLVTYAWMIVVRSRNRADTLLDRHMSRAQETVFIHWHRAAYLRCEAQDLRCRLNLGSLRRLVALWWDRTGRRSLMRRRLYRYVIRLSQSPTQGPCKSRNQKTQEPLPNPDSKRPKSLASCILDHAIAGPLHSIVRRAGPNKI